MHLDVGGHPLAGRHLQVAIVAADGGGWRVDSELVDVRKCGFVPVASHLQTGGTVHHMKVRARLDPTTRILDDVEAEMPTVAIEASEVTGGESCRDPIDRISALSGRTLEEAFPRGVSRAIGGVLGCSHVLALARLVGGTLTEALRSEPDPRERRPGELVWSRTLVFDGFQGQAERSGRIVLGVQLTDLHGAPAPPGAPTMDRFAGQADWRLHAEVDLATASVAHLHGAMRRRTPSNLEDATWTDLGGRVAPLVGQSVFRGFAAACLDELAQRDGDAPLLDALLQLAPAFLQCLGSLSDDWPAAAQRQRAIVGTGGHPDSCYIWRRDGVLGRRLAAEAEAGIEILDARNRPGDG